MTKQRIWTTLLILTPLVLSISLSMDIYVPSLPFIIHSLHTNQQIAQWTLSIYMFGAGLGQLYFGPLTDHFGRRKVVLNGLIIYLIGTTVCLVSKTIGVLIIGRSLQSIGTCAALVVAYAVVRDLYNSKESAKIYSFLNAATALGPVVAPILGGYLQTHFHTWRASFIFLFCFSAASLITTFFFLKETLPENKRVPIKFKQLQKRFKDILRSKDFIKNTYHASSGLTILFIFCCISSYLLINNLHVTQTQYGIAFSSNAITFIIASLLSAQLSNQFSLQLPIKLGGFFIFIGAISMLSINILSGLSTLHFMIPMWLATAGAGLVMGPASALALENFPETAGTASSLINASEFFISGVIGTLLMMHTVTTIIPFAILMLVMAIISISLERSGNLIASPDPGI